MKKKQLRDEVEQLTLTLAQEVKTTEELTLSLAQEEATSYDKTRALRMIARAAVVASGLLAVRFIVSSRPFRFL